MWKPREIGILIGVDLKRDGRSRGLVLPSWNILRESCSVHSRQKAILQDSIPPVIEKLFKNKFGKINFYETIISDIGYYFVDFSSILSNPKKRIPIYLWTIVYTRRGRRKTEAEQLLLSVSRRGWRSTRSVIEHL